MPSRRKVQIVVLRVKLETSDNNTAVWLWCHSPGLLTQDLLFPTPGFSALETDVCLLATAVYQYIQNGKRCKNKTRPWKQEDADSSARKNLPTMHEVIVMITSGAKILPPPLTLILLIRRLID